MEKSSGKSNSLCRRFFPGKPSCIASLNHISRETPNLERIVAFYQDVLGFEQIDHPDFGFPVIWLAIPGGSLSVHFIESCSTTRLAEGSHRNAATGELVDKSSLSSLKPSDLRRGHHLAFDIVDVEAVKAMLTEAGIDFCEAGPADSDIRQLFFYDPDGNGIECIHNPARLRAMGLVSWKKKRKEEEKKHITRKWECTLFPAHQSHTKYFS